MWGFQGAISDQKSSNFGPWANGCRRIIGEVIRAFEQRDPMLCQLAIGLAYTAAPQWAFGFHSSNQAAISLLRPRCFWMLRSCARRSSISFVTPLGLA